MAQEPLTIWTIGHSTRMIEDFLELLKAHQIESLVDVRHFPGSRRYPHFNKEPLSDSLTKVGIEYHHLPRLGGRRQPSTQFPKYRVAKRGVSRLCGSHGD